ncbi:MAG TPA: alpha/beta fold hydrolase [Deltaproteobacteria bacterium]|nr:alpha/beta fold hydrolase [Deltaproteobacteria bacterium]
MRVETGLDRESTKSTKKGGWAEAWSRAERMLAGVTRRRVQGGRPDVEIALLDWGGEGELVLLHHANGFCGATLAPVASSLRDRFRVIAIDARGHGDSTALAVDPASDAYAWTNLASDLEVAVPQILDLTGRSSVALAIGHSLGGALVLAAAQREPALFERILLCDPVILPRMTAQEKSRHVRESGLAAATLKRRNRFPTREVAFDHLRSRGLFARFTPEALALYVGEGTRPTEDGEIGLKCDRRVEAAIFSGGGVIDLYTDAHRVMAEARFIHALGGNFSRARYDDLAGRMNDARVDSLEVGHLFPMEEPGRVVELATGMLSGT